MIVNTKDVRACNLCVRGMKSWFDANHLSFEEFVRNGIDAETLAATGDHYATQVIEAAKKRTGEA